MPEVTGSTTLFVIVGDPIEQVRSPQVINALFAQAGADAVLVPLRVTRKRFAETMRCLMDISNLQGIVLTVPFKVEAMSLVETVLPGALAAGALNAMRRTVTGRWEGDMFDGLGLVRALEEQGTSVIGKRVLLVGTGGAGRAIAMALANHGVSELDLNDLDRMRAEAVAQMVTRTVPTCRCSVASPRFAGHDIVINATPLGMQPADPLPIDLGGIGRAHVLFDIVPKPDITPLMQQAQGFGARTIGGKRMVEGQARAIAEFFGYRV